MDGQNQTGLDREGVSGEEAQYPRSKGGSGMEANVTRYNLSGSKMKGKK